jgi:hypothetical protein
MNSHYVSKFILKNFGSKVCLYNIKSGILKEDIKLEKAYSQQDFYTNDIEDKLNRKIESQFANLFYNKLTKCENQVILKRKELRLVKKFLLISVLRSIESEAFLQKEKRFYDNLKDYWLRFAKAKQMTLEETQQGLADMNPPFNELQIEGETTFEYWMRTLDVILETDGSPEEIMKHPKATYPAHRWAQIINAGYLAFWDTTDTNNKFVITDIGMTSENELGWNGSTVHNTKKTNFLAELLVYENDPTMKNEIAKVMHMTSSFHENFQMFPISATRMIVLIAPFYKFRQMYQFRYQMPPLTYLTELVNEELYYPNNARYVLPQTPPQIKYHEDDEYIYEVKHLTGKEVQYCNALFMDRVSETFGFSSLPDVVRSVVLYKKLNSFPFIPRVDYTNLYKIIEERYGGNLNV